MPPPPVYFVVLFVGNCAFGYVFDEEHTIPVSGADGGGRDGLFGYSLDLMKGRR